MSLQDEARVFRAITWPFLKDFTRWWALSYIPPALLGRSLEREARRALGKEGPL